MNTRVCLIRYSAYLHDLSVRREAESLHQAGFETHVIGLGEEDGDDRQRGDMINGVYVHYLPLTRKKGSIARYLFGYLSFSLLAGLKVTTLHMKHPFTAIQANTMPDFLVFATVIPKLLGAKIMVMMQEPVPELWQTLRGTAPPRVLRLVEQAALAYADGAFTVTQQLKDRYVSRGAAADKISVVLIAPDGRAFEQEEAVERAPEETMHFTLISHGAIEERYGHDTMLEAVALVRPQIPHIRLRILGKGSYADRFLAHRRQLGLEDCVEYLGWVPLPRMIRELRAADVGIVAQRSSPYSNLVHTGKLYDYIHFGKPVLHSRLEAVAAYFDDESLYFFTPGDAQSLARGILDLYQDPVKRRMLVAASQTLYKLYNWERQRQIYLSLYRALLE